MTVGSTGSANLGAVPQVVTSALGSQGAAATTPAPTTYTNTSSSGVSDAVWNDQIASAFMQIPGMTPQYLQQIQDLGLDEDDLNSLYQKLVTATSQATAQGTDASATSTAAPATAAATPAATAAATPAEATAAAPASSGPAAWDRQWRQKFLDAGMAPEDIQTLDLTGANGADEATLESAYKQYTTQTKAALQKLQKEQPKDYTALKSALSKSDLTTVALAYASGQVKSTKDLDALVTAAQDQADQAKQMGSLTNPLSMIKSQAGWMLLGPAYGVARYALAPLFGGKDPIDGSKVNYNPFQGGAMDAAMAVAGVASAGYLGLSVARGLQGAKLLSSAADDGSLVSSIIENEGLASKSKLLGALPVTSTGRQIAALGRMNDIESQINALPKAADAATTWGPRELGENVVSQLSSGAMKAEDTGTRFTALGGLWTNSRTALLHRGRALTNIATDAKRGTSALQLDSTFSGKAMGVNVAATGVKSAPIEKLPVLDTSDLSLLHPAARKALLQTHSAAEVSSGTVKLTAQDVASGLGKKTLLGALQKQVLAQGAKQAGVTGSLSLTDRILPGATADAIKAANGVKPNALIRGLQELRVAHPVGFIGGAVALGLGAVVGGGALYFNHLKSQALAQAAATTNQSASSGATNQSASSGTTNQSAPDTDGTAGGKAMNTAKLNSEFHNALNFPSSPGVDHAPNVASVAAPASAGAN